VEEESLQDLESMSSGSYFPPPVRTVKIPKKNGERKLGIPTVADRIAQQVVKAGLEPEIEPLFHADSYGYRPESRRWMQWVKRARDAGAGSRES
jgi:retron-type reverse transcriptase